jgi:membrane-associated phospholipid phosphatase
VLRGALVVLCLFATSVSADPWYSGRFGKNRAVHLAATVGGGVLFVATDFLEERWAPTECHWCTPTGLDRELRTAWRWEDETWPRRASHFVAFGLTPLVCGGLVLAYTPPTWADVIDDALPIAETAIITLWVTRVLKLGVGRQRPYAHYEGPRDAEDNLSWPSGHTSRSFAIGVSAAVIAHTRDYASEPYIWAATGVLGTATAYFRIAADKHYITDVASGALLGSAIGLTVPWLMRREIEVLPTRNGLSVAGMW